MALHPKTFQYLKPTDNQLEKMTYVRNAFADFASMLETWLDDGPDKTYILRKHRENAMWANVSITREAYGSPR